MKLTTAILVCIVILIYPLTLFSPVPIAHNPDAKPELHKLDLESPNIGYSNIKRTANSTNYISTPTQQQKTYLTTYTLDNLDKLYQLQAIIELDYFTPSIQNNYFKNIPQPQNIYPIPQPKSDRQISAKKVLPTTKKILTKNSSKLKTLPPVPTMGLLQIDEATVNSDLYSKGKINKALLNTAVIIAPQTIQNLKFSHPKYALLSNLNSPLNAIMRLLQIDELQGKCKTKIRSVYRIYENLRQHLTPQSAICNSPIIEQVDWYIPKYINSPQEVAELNDEDNPIPPGFANLINAQQTLLVDVYFLNRKLGTTYITSIGNTIKFSNPFQLTSLVGNLINAAEFTSLIKKSLSDNYHLACTREKTKNCGNLTAVKGVGVIYNFADLRLDLFINSKLLLDSSTLDKYLPQPHSGWSSISRLNASLFKRQGKTNEFGLNISNIIAYNENALFTDIFQQQNNSAYINNFYLQRDTNEKRYRIFLFDTQNLNLIPQQHLFGFNLSSSVHTLKDKSNIYDNDITILLARDSHIKIKKKDDDILIYSQYYRAGLQKISSSFFPEGAYNIRIEIIDDLGNQRVEEQFFVKSTLLPPTNIPLSRLDVGYFATQQNNTIQIIQTPLIRIGQERRIGINQAISLNLLAIDTDILAESSFTHQGETYYMNSSILAASNNEYGIGSNLVARLNNITLSGNITRMWSTNDTEPKINIITHDFLSSNLNLGINVNNLNLSFSYTNNDNITDNQKNYSYGSRINWNIWRNRNYILSLQNRIQKTNLDSVAVVAINISSLANLGLSNSLEYDHSNQNTTNNTNLRWSYLTANKNNLETNISYLNNYNPNNISNISNISNSYNLNSNYRSTYGRYEYSYKKDKNHVQTHTANIDVNLVTNKHTIAAGGKNNNQSAIVVKVVSPTPSSVFKIIINGSERSIVNANTSVPIMLQPYKQYKIQIIAEGKSLELVKDDTKEVVLYPGNVVYLEWKVKRAVVILGYIVDKNMQPLDNALLTSNINTTISTPSGFFQLTTYWKEKITVTKKDGKKCTMEVSYAKVYRNVIRAGILKCLAQ